MCVLPCVCVCVCVCGSEALVQDALARLISGRTTVVRLPYPRPSMLCPPLTHIAHSIVPVSRGCVCGGLWQVIAHRLSTVIAADQIAYIKVRVCFCVPPVANVRPVLLKPRACKPLLPLCVTCAGRTGRSRKWGRTTP